MNTHSRLFVIEILTTNPRSADHWLTVARGAAAQAVDSLDFATRFAFDPVPYAAYGESVSDTHTDDAHQSTMIASALTRAALDWSKGDVTFEAAGAAKRYVNRLTGPGLDR